MTQLGCALSIWQLDPGAVPHAVLPQEEINGDRWLLQTGTYMAPVVRWQFICTIWCIIGARASVQWGLFLFLTQAEQMLEGPAHPWQVRMHMRAHMHTRTHMHTHTHINCAGGQRVLATAAATAAAAGL